MKNENENETLFFLEMGKFIHYTLRAKVTFNSFMTEVPIPNDRNLLHERGKGLSLFNRVLNTPIL